jgi:hypothetical protein
MGMIVERYKLPPCRPPYAESNPEEDAQEKEVTKHALLIIRLDDDLRDRCQDCINAIAKLRCLRRVFIDISTLPHIWSISSSRITKILRPWSRPAGVTPIIADWLPYLTQPVLISPTEDTTMTTTFPLAWHSIFIDISEFDVDAKWELVAHLLMLRDFRRLRLVNGGTGLIRWVSPTRKEMVLDLLFKPFLSALIASMGRIHDRMCPSLRFICLSRALCHIREDVGNAFDAAEKIKFSTLLTLGGEARCGNWIELASDGDARNVIFDPDELQGVLIRSYVDVVYPQQRLRESQEMMLALHTSSGISPEMPSTPRPLPSRGQIQPMDYLEAVRGPPKSGRHPSYEFWQLVAHEAIWYMQVYLMAQGWLRIPTTRLPPPPTFESIRQLNAREIALQSGKERLGWPPGYLY